MAAVEAFCSRWNAEELGLFGSVLRDVFGSDSDIDILARCRVPRTPGLVAVTRMEQELAELLAWGVDPVFRAPIEQSRNNIRRKAILESPPVACVA